MDKAKSYTATESFPTQMPWWAEKSVFRDAGLKDGTGVPGSFGAYGSDLAALQCWQLVDHADANNARPATEFG